MHQNSETHQPLMSPSRETTMWQARKAVIPMESIPVVQDASLQKKWMMQSSSLILVKSWMVQICSVSCFPVFLSALFAKTSVDMTAMASFIARSLSCHQFTLRNGMHLDEHGRIGEIQRNGKNLLSCIQMSPNLTSMGRMGCSGVAGQKELTSWRSITFPNM